MIPLKPYSLSPRGRGIKVEDPAKGGGEGEYICRSDRPKALVLTLVPHFVLRLSVEGKDSVRGKACPEGLPDN